MLKILLEKYINKNISKSEFETLKASINHADDSLLSETLNDLWQSYNTTSELTPEQVSTKLSDLKISHSPKRVRFDFQKIFRVAAAIMLPILSIFSIYLYITNSKLEVYADNNVVISVDKGQKADITLPDGSRVKLNSTSRLSYPAKFGADNRRVEFSGEGYFEVTKDPDKKFIVHTNYIDIEVLGTTFNMMAHETENTIEMTLIEGKVKALTQKKPVKELLVAPNQKIIYNKSTGSLKLKNTNTKDETAWTRGVMLFKSEPLENVLTRIERSYNVSIHINKQDSVYFEDKFTGRFDSIDLKGVLDIIKRHYKFDYTEKGKDIYISKQ